MSDTQAESDPHTRGPRTDPTSGAPAAGAPAAVDATLDSINQHLERLAACVVPLMSRQYDETLNRVRALEKRVLQRQERPTVVRIAHALVTLQKLVDPVEARSFAEEAMTDVLYQLGYEQFGEVGEQFDETRHEAVDTAPGGSDGRGKITQVYERGLQAFDDVVIRARVRVS